jgi:aminopeptidase-like protein
MQEAMLQNTSDISALYDELFPIARSITGSGYRKSLAILRRYIPLETGQASSGQKVFDWTVPPEWNIRDAYLVKPDGSKFAELQKNNLHVVNYSIPVDLELSFDELDKQLHSIPKHPNWIPYVTSYYARNWGFCIADSDRTSLPRNGKYRAYIDSDLFDGSVDYGYYFLRSDQDEDAPIVLLSSYLCHPSMANNELSGPIVLCALYDRIRQWTKRKFTYLFVINPETIGSICFLHRFGDLLKEKMHAGLVLTCLGGPADKLSYKLSRNTNGPLDRIVRSLSSEGKLRLRNFDPSEGSDERQYCSPGFNLPVGQIARTVYGEFPEYHTSADDKSFVRLDKFPATIQEIEALLKLNEHNRVLVRKEPHCEIQLGKRGLYPSVNSPLHWGRSTDTIFDHKQQLKAISYLLSYSDGYHDLVDIAQISGLPLEYLSALLYVLESNDLYRQET